jgi:enoyl-CoA hydratase/carnithine racemase
VEGTGGPRAGGRCRSGVHLISLRGQDGTFVSGADISEFAENRADVDRAKAYEAFNGAAFAALREAKTPTLALIEGFVLAAASAWQRPAISAWHHRRARFAVPAAKLGLAYPVDGVRDLVRLIGPGATKRLFFTADPISADTALRIGFVEEMVEAESFQGAAEKLIATILSRAPLTQRAAKSAIAAAQDASLGAAQNRR